MLFLSILLAVQTLNFLMFRAHVSAYVCEAHILDSCNTRVQSSRNAKLATRLGWLPETIL